MSGKVLSLGGGITTRVSVAHQREIGSRLFPFPARLARSSLSALLPESPAPGRATTTRRLGRNGDVGLFETSDVPQRDSKPVGIAEDRWQNE